MSELNEIKLYIVNLASYNEGNTRGAWFTLPVDWEEVVQELFEPHELDEFGNPQGDHAIHDYEAPIAIREYTSISYLNELAEVFSTLTEEEMKIIIALNEADYVRDPAMAREILDNVSLYPDCKDMSDIAELYVNERLSSNEDRDFILRHFNYKSYGEELDSEGSYIHVEDDLMVEYVG